MGDTANPSTSDWPSWAAQPTEPSVLRKNKNKNKRKRGASDDERDLNELSPPTKKQRSPQKSNTKPKLKVRTNPKAALAPTPSTRQSARRSRRRSSMANLMTPCKPQRERFPAAHIQAPTPSGSIREQRIHRLQRKSNTDLLMDTLMRAQPLQQIAPMIDGLEFDFTAHRTKNSKRKGRKGSKSKNGNAKDLRWFEKTTTAKVPLRSLDGLRAVGHIDAAMEAMCLQLLRLGADPLWLNEDGVSAIYIAMHYADSLRVIAAMIEHAQRGGDAECDTDTFEDLNQTYIFAHCGTLSLLDVALRVGDAKTVKLLLRNALMPTEHSATRAPTVQLLTFAQRHKFAAMAQRALSEQFLEAVENLDTPYMRAILAHGLAIDAHLHAKAKKSALYILVEAPFDVFDESDAKEQFVAIECLLEMGADANSLDATRSPMLVHPLQRSGPWNVKLVDSLLRYGASLSVNVGETEMSVYAYAKRHCVDGHILKVIEAYRAQAKRDGGRRCGRGKMVEIEASSDPMLAKVMHGAKPTVTKSYKRTRKPKAKKAATR